MQSVVAIQLPGAALPVAVKNAPQFDPAADPAALEAAMMSVIGPGFAGGGTASR